MGERPLTLAEVRAAARRAAERIEATWPEWKKRLSDPVVIQIKVATSLEVATLDSAPHLLSDWSG